MTLPIRLDSLQLTDALERAGNLFEAVPAQAQKTKGTACKQGPVWRVAKSGAWAIRHTLRRTKSLKAFSVVSEVSIDRSNPQKARTVLVDGLYRQVIQPIRDPKIPEAVLLCAQRNTHEQHQGKRPRIGSADH